jgi:hypothetical protein
MARKLGTTLARSGLLLAAIAVTVSACGGGGGSGQAGGGGGNTSTPTTAPSAASSAAPAAAKSEIRQNWAAFFNGKTKPQQKIKLLAHGQKFAPVIKKQSKSGLARQTSAKVGNVVLTGPQHATVTYSVLIGGSPALKNQTGHAVRADGTWKISDASFCQLLGLRGHTPPMCPKASPSSPASSPH